MTHRLEVAGVDSAFALMNKTFHFSLNTAGDLDTGLAGRCRTIADSFIIRVCGVHGPGSPGMCVSSPLALTLKPQMSQHMKAYRISLKRFASETVD